jgi:IclR family pca regulon transcriptional regulator
MSRQEPPEEEYVQSLARGLAVIEAFGQSHAALTLSEVARRAEVSRAAARRLLHTLVHLGYAGFDGKTFELRPRVLNLGLAYMSSMGVWQVAQPYLEDLMRATRESCSVAVLDGADIVHVIRMPAAERLMSIAVKVGDRLPAHASAMGRVLLAALPPAELERYFANARLAKITDRTVTDPKKLRALIAEAGRRGYAEVDGELEIGLHALAAPILDRNRKAVAAVALSTLSAKAPRKGAADPLLKPLLACAQHIGQALAVLPGPR